MEDMPADVDNAFIIAFWFEDTALKDNEPLQPQKMQRLLFISQAYYAVINNGRKLMPAVFVANELGPIEPNIFVAFSRGRPDVDIERDLPPDVEDYLLAIWRRFGHYSIDSLNELTKDSSAYKAALKRGRGAEMSLMEIEKSFLKPKDRLAAAKVLQPKVYRTQTGRSVHVKKWKPRKKT